MVPQILYVEDIEDVREITAKILTISGYNVTSAVNGLEALELFRQRRFDIIITDIAMPVMDGNRFISELSAYGKLPPILALSYSYFDISSNPAITFTGVKPMTSEALRLLVYKTLHEKALPWNDLKQAS